MPRWSSSVTTSALRSATPCRQALLAPNVKSDGTEVIRERRDLLEPAPAPKTQAPDQDQRRSVAVDIVLYADAMGREHLGHGATSTFFRGSVYRPSLETLLLSRRSHSPWEAPPPRREKVAIQPHTLSALREVSSDQRNL